jgi:hypothetical protein
MPRRTGVTYVEYISSYLFDYYTIWPVQFNDIFSTCCIIAWMDDQPIDKD